MKKPPFLPTTLINMFERSCDTFGGRVGGRGQVGGPLSSTTLGHEKKKSLFHLKKNNNDHGLDVIKG
jgi:hypothetical protein